MTATGWRQRLHALKRESLVGYYAARDPRLPWHVRLLAILVAAYALSPIDLIPDFIPVLGLLDDVVLLPLAIVVAVKLVPAEVMAECRARANESARLGGAAGRIGAAVIALLWIAAMWFVGMWAY